MAESLGLATLTLSVDDAPLKVGLANAAAQASAAGQSMAKSIEAAQTKQAAISRYLSGASLPIAAVAPPPEALSRWQQLEQGVRGSITRLGSISIPTDILGPLATLTAGAAVFSFFDGAIKGAIELETMMRKLSNTLGPQGAQAAFNFTSQLANQLGLSVVTLTNGFAGFTAAATAANIPMATQREVFTVAATAAQQLGLSNDELQGSLLALGQIASKGTLSMEELRGQLGERMPIALAATARGLGVTTAELISMVSKGQVSAQEFFPAFASGMQEMLSSTSGAPTAAQNLAQFQNAWLQFQAGFGQNILPAVTSAVQGLTKAIEGMTVSMKAVDLGFSANFFGGISTKAAEAVGRVQAIQKQFNLSDADTKKLFQGALKDEGVTNPEFAAPEKLQAVYERLAVLAKEFRAANVDTTGELQKQSIEAAAQVEKQKQLEETAKARAVAERTVAEAGERYSIAVAKASRDDLAAAYAEAQAKINAAIRKEQEAQKAYDDALRANKFDNLAPAVIEAAGRLNAAGIDVQTAMVDGAASIRDATEAAANNLRSAFEQLASAQEKGFDFLSEDDKQALLSLKESQVRDISGNLNLNVQEIADALGAAVDKAGNIDFQGVDPQALFQVASTLEGLAAANDKATQALIESQTLLNGNLQGLIGKNWAVYVQAYQGNVKVQGDVLGGVS